MLHILHFSDCHLLTNPTEPLFGVVTAENLAIVLAHAKNKATNSQLAVVCGDLSQDGSVASYQLANRMFATLNIPVYTLPGNHDSPTNMQTELTGQPIVWQHSLIIAGWQLIFLNSAIPNNVTGLLAEEELSKLEITLQNNPEIPTLLVLHHPPIRVNTPWLDLIGLQNPKALFKIVKCYPWIRCLLFGHVHQARDEQLHGVRILSAPATSVQFGHGTDKPQFIENTLGYRWLQLSPNGTIQTGVNWIANS